MLFAFTHSAGSSFLPCRADPMLVKKQTKTGTRQVTHGDTQVSSTRVYKLMCKAITATRYGANKVWAISSKLSPDLISLTVAHPFFTPLPSPPLLPSPPSKSVWHVNPSAWPCAALATWSWIPRCIFFFLSCFIHRSYSDTCFSCTTSVLVYPKTGPYSTDNTLCVCVCVCVCVVCVCVCVCVCVLFSSFEREEGVGGLGRGFVHRDW